MGHITLPASVSVRLTIAARGQAFIDQLGERRHIQPAAIVGHALSGRH
jgi:hypothetical protein